MGAMRLFQLRNIRSAIVVVLIITCLIVLIVNYKTADELRKYEGREDFYIVHGVGHDEGVTRVYKTEEDYYIDGFDSLLITDTRHNKQGGVVCEEKRNFVFIKTMKCATETVASILRRFGYLRHLNFVLPRKKNIYLGWPFIMEKIDYRPSVKPYNIIVEHSIYNKTVMSKLMPSNSSYITIIREPYSHFKSAFQYFNVANISKINGTDRLSEYIFNIQKYEEFYRSQEGSRLRFCIPNGFSVTKNLLSHCLGMPLGFPEDRLNITTDLKAIHSYIKHLDEEFTLVMIMEYFHESLVLLKRLMCWSMQDIIYHTTNVGNYSFKHQPPKPGHLHVHRSWSSVDYILYDYFNQTFWRKVAQQGDSFQRELAVYNAIQGQVSDYCEFIHDKEEDLKVPASEFNEAFIVTQDYCLLMGMELLTFIKRRFDNEEKWTDPVKIGPKRGC